MSTAVCLNFDLRKENQGALKLEIEIMKMLDHPGFLACTALYIFDSNLRCGDAV